VREVLIGGYKTFGEAARAARERLKISREEAAFNLNVTNKTLYHYELDITFTPPQIARRMVELYDAPWLRDLYYQLYLVGDTKTEKKTALAAAS